MLVILVRKMSVTTYKHFNSSDIVQYLEKAHTNYCSDMEYNKLFY